MMKGRPPLPGARHPVYLIIAATDRQRRRGVLVPLAMLGGGLFISTLVPRTWTLPLWQTFAASVTRRSTGIRWSTKRNSPSACWAVVGRRLA
jgi:hypothetical protein